MQACKAKYKEASRQFTKVKDAEVRKMFRMKMEAEEAKELPQMSKKAHQAFKYVTGSASKGDGLGDLATWTTPSGTTVARGHKEVGDLVSSYTRTTSSADTAGGEFCEEFRATISAARSKTEPQASWLNLHGHPESGSRIASSPRVRRGDSDYTQLSLPLPPQLRAPI